MALTIVFFAICLFVGFGIYILLLQRILAHKVAQQQGQKKFFILSYLLTIPLFYGSMFLIMAMVTKLYPLFSGGHKLYFATKNIEETTQQIAMVFAALLAGILSVIFWAWVLPKKKKQELPR
jgi:Na+/melibiose symporter-like transporter